MHLLLRIAEGKEKGWAQSCRWDAIKLTLAYGIGKPREAVEIFTEERSSGPDLSAISTKQLELLAGWAYCPATCCSLEKSGKPPPYMVVPWENASTK